MTGNILYGGRISSEGDFAAVWTRLYPGTPVPPIRYWVIFNNQFHPPPEIVQPNWKTVLPRSVDLSSRSATVNGIRHLFALATIARLQSGARRLGAAQARRVREGDDERAGRHGRAHGRRPQELAKRPAVRLAIRANA
jgi:hypothetical protein